MKVQVVKSEWHQVEKRYGIEITDDLLSEIYPDLEDPSLLLVDLAEGIVDIDEIIQDAQDSDVELEWEWLNEDDWWTDRKGGYDITYKVADWEVRKDYEPPITHKCTKCKWTGDKWATHWCWEDSEGNKLTDAVKICPMCDSPTELTEVGIEQQKKDEERKARWAKEDEETTDDFPSEEELAEEKKELDAMLENLKESADWPFPDTSEPSLPKLYPAGEYTIRIWGRTREVGLGKITKAQYDHWSSSEFESELSDALNDNYDYEENNTPEEARFENSYYDYNDVKSFWGFDEDDTHMTITNSDGEEIYEGSLVNFIVEAHGDDDDAAFEASEEVEELYLNEYLGKGCFVFWTQGGKGSCIQTTIDTEGEEFDPRKLKYTTWDIQGSSCVNRLFYDGFELDDEGMDIEYDNWRGQWSEFELHENVD